MLLVLQAGEATTRYGLHARSVDSSFGHVQLKKKEPSTRLSPFFAAD
jgi:hypothetical protein